MAVPTEVTDTIVVLETVLTLQNIAGVVASAVTHAGVQATTGIVITPWIAVPANDPKVVDIPAVHSPGGYRPQRSRDVSPRRAVGSSSSYASVATTSSASHRRFWIGSSVGGTAATTRPESTAISNFGAENS